MSGERWDALCLTLLYAVAGKYAVAMALEKMNAGILIGAVIWLVIGACLMVQAIRRVLKEAFE